MKSMDSAHLFVLTLLLRFSDFGVAGTSAFYVPIPPTSAFTDQPSQTTIPLGQPQPSNPVGGTTIPNGQPQPSNPVGGTTVPNGQPQPTNPVGGTTIPNGQPQPSNPVGGTTIPNGQPQPSNPIGGTTVPNGPPQPSNPIGGTTVRNGPPASPNPFETIMQNGRPQTSNPVGDTSIPNGQPQSSNPVATTILINGQPQTSNPVGGTVLPTAQSTPLPFAATDGLSNPAPGGGDTVNPQQDTTLPRLITPPRTTRLRVFTTEVLTTVPIFLAPTQTSALPLPPTPVQTRPSTVVPSNLGPSNTPVHCQLSFANKYENKSSTNYDQLITQSQVQQQVAGACKVTQDRITSVSIQSNSSGNIVIRFTIQQGYPTYTDEAMKNLNSRLDTTFVQLDGQPLVSPVAVYWTDEGVCPTQSCQHNGVCDVTVDATFVCQCASGYEGAQCQDAQTLMAAPPVNRALFALLVLLVIPLAVAVIVGFIVGRRKQQQKQLKRQFDLRDVRTIGPKSMLSLPQEPGIRNNMYDTRSFALAFTDASFATSGTSGSAAASDEDIIKNAF